MKTENYNKIDLFIGFNEIIKGYSEREFRGNPIFVKHLTLSERESFDIRYRSFYETAIGKGISTSEDALKNAIKDDFWSEKDEKEISTSERYLETLQITKKNLFKSAEIKEVERTIADEREKLAKKLSDKRSVLGKTAEEYASNRSNDYIIYESFYKDKELKIKYFEKNDFEELGYDELIECILAYNEFSMILCDLNVQKITLSDFFHPYYLVLDSPMEMFGKPMVNLTDFQVRLLIYGRIFKNIFETNENIPDSIRDDPEALLNYVDKSKAKEKFNSKVKNKGDANAEMVFGASREEVSELSGKNVKNLNEIMRQKKTMNMDELMKLHGEG